MNSQTLREARKYEEAFEKLIPAEQRPKFHLSPRVGWMNDPNGFCIYGDKYHLFYQYHPYDAHWGPMHWGHAVSEDLLHWEFLPVALAPDEYYDKDGVFSGSAITLKDGRHLLIYTGVMKRTVENGQMKEFQTQCVAIGDGLDYEKYENNPVINSDKIPDGASKTDFRDPKIWEKSDGTYRCLVANRPADGSGQLLLFKSDDCIHWDFEKVFAKNERRYGLMWECPDFFTLDGKGVLLTSPQDMLPEGFEFHNGNGNLCIIGSYDDATDTFTEEKVQAVDYGIDFYAMQTILTKDGRRVMIGWMQNWDTTGAHDGSDPWFGQMSLPREVTIKDGRLCQWPIKELDDMRVNKVEIKDAVVEATKDLKDRDSESITGGVSFEGIKGRCLDMELEVKPKDIDTMFDRFVISIAADEKFHTDIVLRPKENIAKIDRKFSGSRRAIVHQRRAHIPWTGESIKVRIVMDRYSMEVFFEEGKYVMTASLPTDVSCDGIYFNTNEDAIVSITKYDLN
ncbi:MAG: glycoside hydrolase family 32 protein [Pseudobutyrivibrio ruminis]|uniref:beta-fructofuranosidase n=1 Tax=Pseudobutyrivibrio ruminis TaxID=46206 RepID=A0A927U5W9_9FIRM|nr:glycoside hydrolase family 32 protein [Pseudobutyrivibrio ruminis]